MSIILNALRKSEQERKSLGLEQSVAISLVPLKKAASRKLINPLLIFGVINLLAFAYLFFKLEQPVTTVAKPSVVAPPRIHPDEPPPVISVSTLPVAPPVGENPKAISDLWAENKKLQENAALKAISVKPKEVVKKTLSSIPIAKATNAEPEAQIETFVDDSVAMNTRSSIEEISEMPQAAVEKPIIKLNNGIPLLRELSSDFQAKVPLSTINVLAYADQPNNRFVIIDMVKYKIGQQIKGKINLLNILPESVVLNFEGQVFRLERP